MEALLTSSTGLAQLGSGAAHPAGKHDHPAPLLAPSSRVAAFSSPRHFRELWSSSPAPTTNPTFNTRARFAPAARAQASSGSRGSASTLGPITIYKAADGEPVQFQELWDQKDGLAMVAFLRHFGCPFCWEFAGKLRDYKPTFDASGIKLITIGVGKPDKARLLVEKLNFPIDNLFCDDERKAYDALQLNFGVQSTFFNPGALNVFGRLNELKNVLTGGYELSAPDDQSGVLQQGGLYVFKGQDVIYARKEEYVGDHPNLDEVLKVVTRKTQSPSFA